MKTNIFNDDFAEFIEALNIAEVEYVLVGGYSVIIHGHNRTTGDMDILVNPSKDNYKKIVKAFELFKMPLFGMTESKFLNIQEYDVFEYGRPPVQIDIITKIKGIDFSEAFSSAFFYEISEDIKVRVIHINALIQAKLASGRLKDLDDVQNLKGKI